MEQTDLIRAFLPLFVLEHFDVVGIENLADSIHISLDEKKIIPADLHGYCVTSYGFTSATTIQDFPVRGKGVFLHIRRRKWLSKAGTIHTRDYKLAHKGTQLSEEFVAFLKAANRI